MSTTFTCRRSIRKKKKSVFMGWFMGSVLSFIGSLQDAVGARADFDNTRVQL